MGRFQKNCRHFQKDREGTHNADPKKNLDCEGTLATVTSEEELLLINEQNELNLVDDDLTWMVNLGAKGASFHLNLD